MSKSDRSITCRDGIRRRIADTVNYPQCPPIIAKQYPVAVLDQDGRVLATLDINGRQAVAFGFHSPYDMKGG